MIRDTLDGYEIEDLGSKNSTTRTGMLLVPGQPMPLADGDELRFGAVTATFRLLGNNAMPPPFSVP